MTTFQDGPAKGQCLMLSRAPMFLRVVHVQTNHFDALDQPDDRARDDEKIYAYRLVGKAGRCHINRRGGSGGWFSTGTYTFVPVQPSDADMRSNEAWRTWCLRQVTPPEDEILLDL